MDDRIIKARGFFERGIYHYNRGSFQEAVVHFQEAIELYPAHIVARLYLATAMARQKHFDAALRVLDAGNREQNLDGASRVRILKLASSINLMMGNYDISRQLLQEAASINGDDSSLLNQIGTVCLKSGAYHEGFEAFLAASRGKKLAPELKEKSASLIDW